VTLLRDLRYGLRILAKHPTFAMAALSVMALGIGATTAVFSVLRGVLITPLPYRDPAQLVLVRAALPGFAYQPALTSLEFAALRDRADLFEDVAAAVEANGSLTAPDDMAPLNAVAVSDSFLRTLGVAPVLGRAVRRGDAGQRGSIDISYDVWQRHFHGDPSIVGRAIEVNGNPMIVAGVLPRGFKAYLGSGVAVLPQIDLLYFRGVGYDEDPFRGNVVIARLQRGVTIDTARVAVDVLAKNLVAARPSSYPTGPVRLSLSPLEADVVSEVKPALLAATGAVALVLIVACANLANLLLARASARTREMAVRISIGASRGRIVRQLLAEGGVIGAIGATAGWLLAQWGVDALLALAPAALPRRETIAVDGTVALLAVTLAVAAALVTSLVPAWHATRSDVAGGLKKDGAHAAGVTRGLLVAAQLALSVVLLVGAGLMTRAFIGLRSVPLGFDPHRAASLFVSLSGTRFGTGTLDEARARRREFYQQLVDEVRDAPGLQRAGVGFPVPLSGVSMSQRVSLGPETPERQIEGFIAFAGYLEALGVPLLAGRSFARADDSQPLVVVDEWLARELWPNESAIGRRLLVVNTVGSPRWTEVVGVVAHVQSQGLRGPGSPQVWMTYAVRSYAQLNLVVRAADPMAAIAPVARAVQQLGAGRPIRDVRLLDDYVSDASADTRFALFVLGVLSALALVLAAVGVYGVVAYATARRTREIAVRLALGADGRRIVGLIIREGLGWTAAGITAGVLGALALSRYVSSLLFHVGERDPMTYLSAALLLVGIAVLATAIPAVRAVQVDPMLALRSE
jgi:putative ABC transport system permease protein